MNPAVDLLEDLSRNPDNALRLDVVKTGGSDEFSYLPLVCPRQILRAAVAGEEVRDCLRRVLVSRSLREYGSDENPERVSTFLLLELGEGRRASIARAVDHPSHLGEDGLYPYSSVTQGSLLYHSATSSPSFLMS